VVRSAALHGIARSFCGERPDQLQRFSNASSSSLSTRIRSPTLRYSARDRGDPPLRIAFDDGEFNLEVPLACRAGARLTGQIVGALGISGPVWRLSIQALQSRAKMLQGAADRLSLIFGAKDFGTNGAASPPNRRKAERLAHLALTSSRPSGNIVRQ